jgi:hypothetical protein
LSLSFLVPLLSYPSPSLSLSFLVPLLSYPSPSLSLSFLIPLLSLSFLVPLLSLSFFIPLLSLSFLVPLLPCPSPLLPSPLYPSPLLSLSSLLLSLFLSHRWGEGAIVIGIFALTAFSILGIVSLPSVAARMSWKEWSFIQSFIGYLGLACAGIHILMLLVTSVCKDGRLECSNFAPLDPQATLKGWVGVVPTREYLRLFFLNSDR